MIPPVAAVVVAYKSTDELPICLSALQGRVSEAVVVDNDPERSSSPYLRGLYSWVSWIDNPTNRGFAGAVNQGILATSAPYILLLNPDCELLTGLEDLVDACRQPGVAGAGGRLVDPDGTPQVGFNARSLPTPWALVFEVLGINRIWETNPVNRRYRLLGLDPRRKSEVGQPAGAFLMCRRDALQAVGGLDEGFRPVWFEDVDLCRRLQGVGLALLYVPGSVARHTGGHAVRKLPERVRLGAWYGGLLRYAEKHYPRGRFRCVRHAVMVGLALRKLYRLVGGESSSTADAYGATLRFVRTNFPRRHGSS